MGQPFLPIAIRNASRPASLCPDRSNNRVAPSAAGTFGGGPAGRRLVQGVQGNCSAGEPLQGDERESGLAILLLSEPIGDLLQDRHPRIVAVHALSVGRVSIEQIHAELANGFKLWIFLRYG